MTSIASTPRCAAIVGPYLSGKTTLMEAMLFAAGAIPRKGSVKDGTTVGDGSAEARARQTSTELSLASMRFLDDDWTLIDCPGSVELLEDARAALMVADMAVVVCEPAPDRAVTVAPLLKFLDDNAVPHVIFINRVDQPGATVRGTLDALQGVSARPLVLREIPIRKGDQVTGFIDLVSERAYRYAPGKASEMIQLPEATAPDEQAARTGMLEALADFDDTLLAELLEDMTPSTEEIYANLTRDLQQDLIVPVLFGSADAGFGINRLLKLLRHETPDAAVTAARHGIDLSSVAATVFKTLHAGHAGKMSLARVWSGEIVDGATFDGVRVGGLNTLMGQTHTKVAKAVAGTVAALGRMEVVTTGTLLTAKGMAPAPNWPAPPAPLFSLAIKAEKQSDEVKLSGALAKIADEDPAIVYGHDEDTGEFLLSGQGDVHLQVALARLENRFGLKVKTQKPQVPYKETIRKAVSQHARHKKQSGGHGEFGDVHIDIKPLPRGEGFVFSDSITGGVVPKQYIPAVEKGVAEYLKRGPLGFPVVDIAVTLTDGQFHAVDSSDMAFQKAAQQAMREGMPNAGPVLLEPIFKVAVAVPSEFTSKAQRLVTGRRGQLLGFDAKADWTGWDEVQALMPQSELQDMVIELRSLTLGVGTFECTFDHLQDLSGKEADQIVAARKAALEH